MRKKKELPFEIAENTESAKSYHPKHPTEGSTFWPDGMVSKINFQWGEENLKKPN